MALERHGVAVPAGRGCRRSTGGVDQNCGDGTSVTGANINTGEQDQAGRRRHAIRNWNQNRNAHRSGEPRHGAERDAEQGPKQCKKQIRGRKRQAHAHNNIFHNFNLLFNLLMRYAASEQKAVRQRNSQKNFKGDVNHGIHAERYRHIHPLFLCVGMPVGE